MHATRIPQARKGRLGAAPRQSPLLLLLGAALALLCTLTAAQVDAASRWSVQGPSAEMLRQAAAAAPQAAPQAAPPLQALLQAADDVGAPPPPPPAPELPDVSTCKILMDGLLSNCSISLDRISMTYSRGGERPPTQEEQAECLLGLEQAGLPPARRVHAVLLSEVAL